MSSINLHTSSKNYELWRHHFNPRFSARHFASLFHPAAKNTTVHRDKQLYHHCTLSGGFSFSSKHFVTILPLSIGNVFSGMTKHASQLLTGPHTNAYPIHSSGTRESTFLTLARTPASTNRSEKERAESNHHIMSRRLQTTK